MADWKAPQFVHDDKRECTLRDDDQWYYRNPKGAEKICRKKDHPSGKAIRVQREAAQVLIDHGIEFTVASFKNVDWPIPQVIADCISEVQAEVINLASVVTMDTALKRVQTVHQDENGICTECGTEMPCETIRALMGQINQEEEMSEQQNKDEGIQVESKEGDVTHEMKPSDQGVEKKEDSNDEGA